MTTADTDRGVGIGVHAIYPDLFHEIHMMSQYFKSFATIWDACIRLAEYHRVAHDPAILDQPRTWNDVLVLARESRRALILRVNRLHVGSPMVVTFAVEGSIAAVAVYATHLFARVLRDPRSVGAWLPRLVAGWHEGMKEAEMRRAEREGWGPSEPFGGDSDEQQLQQIIVEEFLNASNRLLSMRAEEVTTIGLDSVPDDLADSGPS